MSYRVRVYDRNLETGETVERDGSEPFATRAEAGAWVERLHRSMTRSPDDALWQRRSWFAVSRPPGEPVQLQAYHNWPNHWVRVLDLTEVPSDA